jgi:hypothetical protein
LKSGGAEMNKSGGILDGMSKRKIKGQKIFTHEIGLFTQEIMQFTQNCGTRYLKP